MDVVSEDFSPAVEQLWQQFQPLAESRAAEVERYAELRRRGQDNEQVRSEARSCAHALAGALGSYGRAEGSALASEVETLLALPGAEPARLGELSTRLTAAVQR